MDAVFSMNIADMFTAINTNTNTNAICVSKGATFRSVYVLVAHVHMVIVRDVVCVRHAQIRRPSYKAT